MQGTGETGPGGMEVRTSGALARGWQPQSTLTVVTVRRARRYFTRFYVSIAATL